MVKTAVIVAAGLGSRLKDRTKEQPKGFLEVAGQSLILRSIQRLEEAGIERLILGTGYLSEHYEQLAETYQGRLRIETKRSDLYASTSSMYTLAQLRDLITEDFVLLESDLLYEPRALSSLLNDSRPDVMLISGFTDSRDEVWVQGDEGGNLFQLSKQRDQLTAIDGELVGITKVSLKAFEAACRFMDEAFETNPKWDYEGCLVQVSRHVTPVALLKIEDLAWCEIDDEVHLERALSQILPRIEAALSAE